MDSERRHELETNDLKEFLDNFKDFWEKHGNKVLIVLIAALLVYAGPKYYGNWEKKKENEAAEALTAATSVETLLAVADEHERVRDEATRKAADLLMSDARVALIAGESDEASKKLDRASAAYTALAERGQTTPYQLVGHEGLAKVAIMKEQWDEAKSHYETLAEVAGETYTYHAAKAKAKIEALPKLKDTVAFSPPAPVSIEPGLLPGGTGGIGLPGESGTGTGGFSPVLPDLNLPDLSKPVDPVEPIEPFDGGTGETE